MAVHDPKGFFTQLGAGTLVADEVQLAPSLSWVLRLVVDQGRRAGRFVATGSSNLLPMPGLGDSLAGRAITLRLRGFSLGSARGRRDGFVPALRGMPDPFKVRSSWMRLDYASALTRGGVVELSVSRDHTDDISSRAVAYEEVVFPNNPNRFIRLTTNADDTAIAEVVLSQPCTLTNIGVQVSTGRVVGFRSRHALSAVEQPDAVPLVYPGNRLFAVEGVVGGGASVPG